MSLSGCSFPVYEFFLFHLDTAKNRLVFAFLKFFELQLTAKAVQLK